MSVQPIIFKKKKKILNREQFRYMREAMVQLMDYGKMLLAHVLSKGERCGGHTVMRQ